MTPVIVTLLSIIVSFFIGMIIAPIIISWAKRLKARQTILCYVEQHKEKEGTPTFGGFIFIFATILSVIAIGGYKTTFGLYMILILFSYGVIGFLDDFIKIKFKRNKGLNPYQKIISQLLIAGIASYFCYKNDYIGSSILIPILNLTVDLKFWYIPFAMFVFLALSNAVNLTDGLDGLAGTTTIAYNFIFLIIIVWGIADASDIGNTFYAIELTGLAVFIGSLLGSLMSFLWQNTYKAKVFMGDTGSLALGGVAAAVALFVKNPLISILIGIMFVVSCITVIVQVCYYKITGKRIFKMSPLHHHLELCGYSESKIVSFYGIVTIIVGIVSLIIM